MCGATKWPSIFVFRTPRVDTLYYNDVVMYTKTFDDKEHYYKNYKYYMMLGVLCLLCENESDD